MGVTVDPSEDDSLLVVDPYRVEAFEIASELLMTIGRRNSQIVEFGRSMDKLEFSFGDSRDAMKVSNDQIIDQFPATAITK
jgi:hypothetical protein